MMLDNVKKNTIQLIMLTLILKKATIINHNIIPKIKEHVHITIMRFYSISQLYIYFHFLCNYSSSSFANQDYTMGMTRNCYIHNSCETLKVIIQPGKQ